MSKAQRFTARVITAGNCPFCGKKITTNNPLICDECAEKLRAAEGGDMNIRDCAGCKYFTKYYGNKNKLGERTVSNYWCVKKNGFIRSFPKKCPFKSKEG